MDRKDLGLMTVDELANLLGVKKTYLYVMRNKGLGIPYIKIGHRIFYKESDVKDYIESCYVKITK